MVSIFHARQERVLAASHPDVLAPPSTHCIPGSNGFPGKSLRSARVPLAATRS